MIVRCCRMKKPVILACVTFAFCWFVSQLDMGNSLFLSTHGYKETFSGTNVAILFCIWLKEHPTCPVRNQLLFPLTIVPPSEPSDWLQSMRQRERRHINTELQSSLSNTLLASAEPRPAATQQNRGAIRTLTPDHHQDLARSTSLLDFRAANSRPTSENACLLGHCSSGQHECERSAH